MICSIIFFLISLFVYSVVLFLAQHSKSNYIIKFTFLLNQIRNLVGVFDYGHFSQLLSGTPCRKMVSIFLLNVLWLEKNIRPILIPVLALALPSGHLGPNNALFLALSSRWNNLTWVCFWDLSYVGHIKRARWWLRQDLSRITIFFW